MPYRLLAADYDLTLTREDRSVSPRVREAIRSAAARGNVLTLATGRLSGSARPAAALFPGDVPLILCNGALIQSSATGAILHEDVMDPAAAEAVMRWAAGWPETCVVWCRAGLFSDRLNEAAAIYARLSAQTPKVLLDPPAAARSGVYKILLLGDAETVARAGAALREDPVAEVNAFTSSPEVLEIVAPGVDKGTGLRRAAELLGIPREEVIALGDGENDIPMLRWAGLGVAMGNASPRVKAAADRIAPSCQEDGAAWVMENYLTGSPIRETERGQ